MYGIMVCSITARLLRHAAAQSEASRNDHHVWQSSSVLPIAAEIEYRFHLQNVPQEPGIHQIVEFEQVAGRELLLRGDQQVTLLAQVLAQVGVEHYRPVDIEFGIDVIGQWLSVD